MMVEPETYSPDVLAEDEPRYLRRQKPVEIRKRKFGKQQRRVYLRVFLGMVGSLAAGAMIYTVADYVLFSPLFLLKSPEQIEITGMTHVTRTSVVERFLPDRDRSVLRVPLEKRRRALEEIPWVEQARVARVLPARIRVELVERTPVAFLRQASELALIDAYGAILERPMQGDFRFPVVIGVSEGVAREERAKQMAVYTRFLKEIELARPGATSQVSEVDLSDANDVRATLAGMPELGDPSAGGQAAVLVHFGSSDFQSKFQTFVDNIGQWRTSAGRVESIDLRFERQVVVNPEPQAAAARTPAVPAAQEATTAKAEAPPVVEQRRSPGKKRHRR